MAEISSTHTKWNESVSFTRVSAAEIKRIPFAELKSHGFSRYHDRTARTLDRVELNHSETIDVAAGLLFRNGQLLITRRRSGDHLGGLWEFPGGKRRQGESFEACLQRELIEELGVEVAVIGTIDSIAHQYPEKLVYIRFFRCSLESGEPEPLECDALAWITRNQIGDYEFPAADQRLLDTLRNTTSLWNTQ